MMYKTLNKTHSKELVELFRSVFTSSEGQTEGTLIGKLVSELASHIENEEIICFGGYEKELFMGSCFFTQLTFHAPIKVYMLAPVAVDTAYQGQGIGQALIRYGLNELKKRQVQVAITYGDPSFYSKVGFQALPEKIIQAPLKLSMPFGWLGQSLTEKPIPTINERPLCVKAFNDPVYW